MFIFAPLFNFICGQRYEIRYEIGNKLISKLFDMERITDKLRKLLALAENAKRLLEAQLIRYGMTLSAGMEDIHYRKSISNQ